MTKQILASTNRLTLKIIEDMAILQVANDPASEEKIAELGIPSVDYRKVIGEILETPPIIGIPIDKITNDLRSWASSLRNEVKLWVITKYTDLDDNKIVAYEFPEEFKPEFDSATSDMNKTQAEIDTRRLSRSDITLSDLIDAGVLVPGQTLVCEYKPRSGEKRMETAILKENGDICFNAETYISPSNAAIKVIHNAGSERNTVNGWTFWKTEDGCTLDEIRCSVRNRPESGDMD